MGDQNVVSPQQPACRSVLRWCHSILDAGTQVRGQTRLAEMNQQVLTNLDNIITSLHDDAAPPQVTDAS